MKKANASLGCAQRGFGSRGREVNRAPEMLVQRETVGERWLGECRSVSEDRGAELHWLQGTRHSRAGRAFLGLLGRESIT